MNHRCAAKFFARAAAKVPGVLRVTLFGSVARGTETGNSDVDVAVVVARKTRRLQDEILRLATEATDAYRVAVVPLFLTPREAIPAQLRESLESGTVLWEARAQEAGT